MISELEQFLVTESFAIFLVFCRIGTAIMLMPGVGEMYVPVRVRVLFALSISYLLSQVMYQQLPDIPTNVATLFVLLGSEILIGAFIGMLTKTLLSAMHTMGLVIASMSSLASAMLFDPTQGAQSAAVGLFMTVVAITVMFALGMHQLMLGAFVDTYSLMIPGEPPIIHDMANYTAHMVSNTFNVAIQLSTPIISFALITYLGAGVLSRLMPQMQVFFVIIPLQVTMSFTIIMTTLTAIMLWYMKYVEETLTSFLEP